jgi:succinyl-CoA synthetase beta subunit
MNLHEYQGKTLLREHGVAVPPGAVASSADEAVAAARLCGSGPWYIKAQILAGGRATGHFSHAPASGGGVRLCDTLAQVEQHAQDMLGKALYTVQTGSGGLTVRQVYVEKAIDVTREVYAALMIDRRSSGIALMTSADGGTQIEQAYGDDNSTLQAVEIDIDTGLDELTARKAAAALNLSDAESVAFTAAMQSLYRMFIDLDCSLIEINPLAITTSGEVCALDATVTIDDNALYRQQALAELRDTRDLSDGELEALRNRFNYFKLDGNIGIVASGASMAMATLDSVKLHGGDPANFLDIPPVADAQQFAAALNLVLNDPAVAVVLVNVFGGGVMRCDDVARALLQARADSGSRVPVVARLAGTKSTLGLEMLSAEASGITIAADILDAARISVDSASRNKLLKQNSDSWWRKIVRGTSAADEAS